MRGQSGDGQDRDSVIARWMVVKRAIASQRTRRAVNVCAAVLIISAMAFTVHVRPAATAGSAAGPACHHVRGPFGVTSGRMVTGSGHRFTPYGINLTLLRQVHGGYGPSVAAQQAEEHAAATAWCANLVRIFALQEELIVHGRLNRVYLAAIETSISHAEADGLAVVLTLDQNAHYAPRLPVQSTLLAWQALAPCYGHDPQVIFDIFNEPSGRWPLWRNGGRYGGRVYYGMERVAKVIRSHGGHNLLWVQGHHRGGNLTGIPRWHLSGVGPIAYDEHRPPAPHTAASWTASFGFLTASHRYAVVEGEWADYSRADAGWACWADAPTSVSQFLDYLAQRGMGLVAFDLSRPWLLESASLTDPNQIRGNWACANGLDEGAGRQIMDWFARRNSGQPGL
jgi:Cellulase (glycosyl hydrolase family 5)